MMKPLIEANIYVTHFGRALIKDHFYRNRMSILLVVNRCIFSEKVTHSSLKKIRKKLYSAISKKSAEHSRLSKVKVEIDKTFYCYIQTVHRLNLLFEYDNHIDDHKYRL